GFARDQLPRAGAETERLVGQRADRAHVDDVAGQFALDRTADIGADLHAVAAIHATQLVGAGELGGDADAAGAVDAARHVAGHQRPEVLVGHDAFALGEAADRAAITHGQILQLALAALIADRAIQRVVDQQELHHVALRIQRTLGLGV